MKEFRAFAPGLRFEEEGWQRMRDAYKNAIDAP
jgi:hypothetical protein